MDRRETCPGGLRPQRGGARRHAGGPAAGRLAPAAARRRSDLNEGTCQRQPGRLRRARPRDRGRQGAGDGRGGQGHRAAAGSEDGRAHRDERRALVVLRWVWRSLRRHPTEIRRCGRQHCAGDSRQAHHRLRGPCQLFTRRPGPGAATLRQQADHRRALRRKDASGTASWRRFCEQGRPRGRALRSDPEGPLVQALGQHDDEPDQRDHRRDHRSSAGRRAGARLHPYA